MFRTYGSDNNNNNKSRKSPLNDANVFPLQDCEQNYDAHVAMYEQIANELNAEANLKSFEEVETFLKRRSQEENSPLVPLALILGCIDVFDNEKLFEGLGKYFVNNQLADCKTILLKSVTCGSVESLFSNFYAQIVSELLLEKEEENGVDEDSDLESVESPAREEGKKPNLKTIIKDLNQNKSFTFLKKLVNLLHASNYRRKIVVMIDNCENMKKEVVQQFIQTASFLRTTHRISLLLVLGTVNSSLLGIHDILTIRESVLVDMRQFRTKAMLEVFNSLFDKIIIQSKLPLRFHLSTLEWLNDRFTNEDFSLHGFVRGLRFACMEYFARDPLAALCGTPKDGESDLEWAQRMVLFARNNNLMVGLKAKYEKKNKTSSSFNEEVFQEALLNINAHRLGFGCAFQCYVIIARALKLPFTSNRELFLTWNVGEKLVEIKRKLLIQPTVTSSSTVNIRILNELLVLLEGKIQSEPSLSDFATELTSLLNDPAFSLPIVENVTQALSTGVKQTRTTKARLERMNNEELLLPKSILNSQLPSKTPKNVQFGPAKRRKMARENVFSEVLLNQAMEEEEEEEEQVGNGEGKRAKTKLELINKKELELMLRERVYDFIEKLLRKHLVPVSTLALGGIFTYADKGSLMECMSGNVKAAVKIALSSSSSSSKEHLFDLQLAHKALENLSNPISIMDWYQSFHYLCNGKKKQEEVIKDRTCLARFQACFSELEYIGCVKMKRGANDLIVWNL